MEAYLILILVFVVLIALIIVLVFIIFVFKLVFEVVHVLLELQRLASEPVNGARDEFLLDVFAELIVELELGFEILINLFVFIRWWHGWVEEIEE